MEVSGVVWSSSGFDGYTTHTEETPQLLILVTGVVVVFLVILGPFSTVCFGKPMSSFDPQNDDRRTTHERETTDTGSLTASTDGRSRGGGRRGRPYSDSPSSLSRIAEQQRHHGGSSVLWSQPGDDPSVTQHRSNTGNGVSVVPSATPTARSRATSGVWWKKSTTHDGEFLRRSVLAATSAISAPAVPIKPSVEDLQVFRKRAVMSEAAAGSMIMTKEELTMNPTLDDDDYDDEEGIEVDEDDIVVRSHLPIQYQPNTPEASRFYYDYGDDNEDHYTVASAVASVMPPLHPDAVSPEDAADAHDIGKLVKYPSGTTTTIASSTNVDSSAKSAQFGKLLDVANPYFENRRLFLLASRTILGAITEPVQRLFMAGLISWFLDTESMVAYLLVHLLLHIPIKEVSEAIVDVESNLVQDSILLGGEDGLKFAGQSIQLATLLQLALSIPLLALWYFVTHPVVVWLLGSAPIAELEEVYARIADVAAAYAKIIAIEFIIRFASRTLFLPFRMMHQGHSEYLWDAGAYCVTFAGVIFIGRTSNEQQLSLVGWVQVAVGALSLCLKLCLAKAGGLTTPYERGFFASITICNPKAVIAFISQAMPLFVGSLIERREWDVFTLFIRYFGGAEVAVWALMGIFWEIFTCYAEGLGEAASNRVSFYLTSGLPAEARLLANKTILIAMALAMGVASVSMLIEPIIAVLLTPDSTLQNLLVQLIGMVGLANAAMVFAQVYCSLLGALGEFGKAAVIMLFSRWLVMLPLALLAIYQFQYDLRSVAGSIALGYGVSACAAALYALNSDWQKASRDFQQTEADALVDDRRGDENADDQQNYLYGDESFGSASDIDTYDMFDQKIVEDSVTLGSTAVTSQATERLDF